MQCNYVSLGALVEEGPFGATASVQAALGAAGACIVGVEQMDEGLVVSFELRAQQLPGLLERLRGCARLLNRGAAEVERLVYELQPQTEVYCTLHVQTSTNSASGGARRHP